MPIPHQGTIQIAQRTKRHPEDNDMTRMKRYQQPAAYVKGLIALRKSISSLHPASYYDIAANLTIISQSDNVVGYRLKDGDNTYVMLFNANTGTVTVPTVTAGKYWVSVDDGTMDLSNPPVIAIGTEGYQARGPRRPFHFKAYMEFI